jgi:diguanylate cyclase (GGDEF)-like protein
MTIEHMFDQSSFLIAIGFAAGALALSTMVVWLGSRSYNYLLCWGAGLGFCVPSVALLGLFMKPYSPMMNLIAYAFLITGVGLIAASGSQFRTGGMNFRFSIIAWTVSMGLTALPFLLGLSGLGVIVLNLAVGAMFFQTASEFWRARAESKVTLIGISGAYAMLGISFWLCPIPLIQGGLYVIHERQQNWAEDINSSVIIFSMAVIGALMLVVAQNRATQNHRREARSDLLTGLLNRRALFEVVEHEGLAAGNAVIMFDLDNFKSINDRFGHAKGDEALIRFANILSSRVRPTDLAARLGGEEFCVLMHAASAETAHEVAERVRAALADSEPLASDFGSPTVSAGIGICHGAETTFEELLRQADASLYLAKQSGRNRVHGPSPRLAA